MSNNSANKDIALKKNEQKLEQLNTYVTLWQSFYNYIQKARQGETLADDDEMHFMAVKSSLAQQYPMLIQGSGQLLSDDKTLDVLASIISLKAVPALSDMQYKRFETEWHHSYIRINTLIGKCIGAKNSPTEFPLQDSKKRNNILLVLVIVLVLEFVILYLLFFE